MSHLLSFDPQKNKNPDLSEGMFFTEAELRASHPGASEGQIARAVAFLESQRFDDMPPNQVMQRYRALGDQLRAIFEKGTS